MRLVSPMLLQLRLRRWEALAAGLRQFNKEVTDESGGRGHQEKSSSRTSRCFRTQGAEVLHTGAEVLDMDLRSISDAGTGRRERIAVYRPAVYYAEGSDGEGSDDAGGGDDSVVHMKTELIDDSDDSMRGDIMAHMGTELIDPDDEPKELTLLPKESLKLSESNQLRVGLSVRLCNLKAHTEFNGQEGTIVAWDDDKNRWRVRMAMDDEENHLKPENLEPLEVEKRPLSAASFASARTSLRDEHGWSDDSQEARTRSFVAQSRGIWTTAS